MQDLDICLQQGWVTPLELLNYESGKITKSELETLIKQRMDKLEFKDLTYHCNITDLDGLRVYKVVGWDSKKGSVDVLHHLDRVTASISNFKGIELSNEVLNTIDAEMPNQNICHIGDVCFTSAVEFEYLHQIQRSYLAETNEVLEYKPIV